jgi:hypothetical protein
LPHSNIGIFAYTLVGGKAHDIGFVILFGLFWILGYSLYVAALIVIPYNYFVAKKVF